MAAYASKRRAVALFCQMRLGKTLPAVRVIRQYKPQDARGLRILVAMPGSCVRGWRDTLAEEGIACMILDGMTKAKRLKKLAEVEDFPGHLFVLINKEAFLSVPVIAAMKWDCVVLDESPFIRNPQTKVSKFFCGNFRLVPYKWILTGTPNPESDLEYYQQMKFLGQNMLGAKDYWECRAKYFIDVDYNWHPLPGVREQLQSWLSTRVFTLRRKDVKMEVNLVPELRMITLPPNVRKTYDQLEEEFYAEHEGQVIETKYEGAKWQHLRQLCDGTIGDKLVFPGKINEVVTLMKGELKGQSVVVWFVYNHGMKHCCEALNKAGIAAQWLAGEHLPEHRRKVADDFSKRKFSVLLCQTKIATYGENFSVADTAIFYGLPPGNLERMQVQERIIHLDKVEKRGVLVIDLVVEDSVDEDLYDLSTQKKHATISAGDAIRRLQERRAKRGSI